MLSNDELKMLKFYYENRKFGHKSDRNELDPDTLWFYGVDRMSHNFWAYTAERIREKMGSRADDLLMIINYLVDDKLPRKMTKVPRRTRSEAKLVEVNGREGEK